MSVTPCISENERQNLMYGALPVYCSFWDDGLRVVDCSDGVVSFFGLRSKQEYIERHFDLSPEYQLDGQQSREKAQELLKYALDTGKCTFEWMHQKLDREYLPTEVTLIRVKTSDGRNAVVSYTRDLRVDKLETTKSRAEEKYADLMLSTKAISCSLWDEELNIINCNQAAAELFELRDKMDFVELFYELSPEYQPDGRPSKETFSKMVSKAFELGHHTFEWMHQNLEGKAIPAYVTLVRVDSGVGRKAVVGYTRDLRTEKVETAKAKAAEYRTHILLNAMPISCGLWDEELNLIDCNYEAMELFGISASQDQVSSPEPSPSKEHNQKRHLAKEGAKALIGNVISPEYQPDGALSREKGIEWFNKAFECGKASFEWVHQNIMGEQIPAFVTLVRVDLGDGRPGVAAFSQDLRQIKATEAKIRVADMRTKILLDSTPLSVSLWNADFEALDCNLEALNLFGAHSRQEFIDRFLNDFSPQCQTDGSPSAQRLIEKMKVAMETGRAEFEWLHQNSDGEIFPAHKTLVKVNLGNGAKGLASYTRDLRAEKAAEAKIKAANEYIKIMFDVMPLGCTLWNRNGNCVDCNNEAIVMLGASSREELMEHFFDFSPERQGGEKPSKEMAMELLEYTFEYGGIVLEWIHQKLSGEAIPCEVTIVRSFHGHEYIAAAYIRDLREIKDKASKLHLAEQFAFSDSLTGIRNRHYFMQIAKLEFSSQKNISSHLGIIFFDIDHFKLVNDTFGHDAGDHALRMVATAAQKVVRESDVFARYGGEEFIILAKYLELDILAKLAERIISKIETMEVDYGGAKIPLTASAGVAIRKDASHSLDLVIKHADLALYRAKANGRNRVEIYTD